MAAVLNAQLTALLAVLHAALDGAAAGLGNEFVAHVGSTMAMAAAMPADWHYVALPTATQNRRAHRRTPSLIRAITVIYIRALRPLPFSLSRSCYL